MIEYSFKVYKKDGRTSSGERFYVEQIYKLEEDLVPVLVDKLNRVVFKDEYRIEVNPLYVTKKNLMTGEEYQERYDTPYCCSPSSETFWSM